MEGLNFVVCLTFAAFITDVFSSAGNEWTYRGAKGPEHWHLDFPHCGGMKQSPISVTTSEVIIDMERLTPIVFKNYDTSSSVDYTLENNGHTVQVDLNVKESEVTGGGLPGTFVAQQFHFHWGATDERGSEHNINGKHFPMEMHVVHYNAKYGNITSAINKDDGVAVLGFFFEIGRYNDHFQEIINHFRQIMYKNEMVDIKSMPLVQLMPAKLSKFYRYLGSLTTPPCYESVTWTLFNETIEIAEEQLVSFRTTVYENVKDDGNYGRDISDDFRMPQCLFRRRVYASHPDLQYAIYTEEPTAAGTSSQPLIALLISCVTFLLLSM
uniref:Carbonic anhydrase n=1 Tax=Archivesica packardana TaxID=1299447 RepID=A0A5P8D1C5_9BIVA|nr:carbonic anhydrase [Archivesica packardana]